MTISIDQAVIDLAVAGGLSALIGFERQWRNRLAGLRTNVGCVGLGEPRDLRGAGALVEPSSHTSSVVLTLVVCSRRSLELV